MAGEITILDREPNSLVAGSIQTVKMVRVSEEIYEIYDAYKNGGKTDEEEASALTKIEGLRSTQQDVYAVFLNIYDYHASVCFVKCDSMKSDDSLKIRRNLLKLSNRGLDSFFEKNRIEVKSDVFDCHQVDLYTTDGHEYRIGMKHDRRLLSTKAYAMFKCFEIVGFSFYEIEWAYLMAAQDWYDTITNNCLVFSKRFVKILHKRLTGNDLGEEEINKLDQLYISSAFEVSSHDKQSRVSFFLLNILSWILVVILLFIVFLQWMAK